MDKDHDSLLDELPPGGMTRFTSITGAIGNYGMLLGAATYAAHHGYKFLAKNDRTIVNDKWAMATVGASAIGAVFGIVHGIKEANDIQNYREAVAGKIDGMSKRIVADGQKIDALTKAVNAQAEGQQAAYAR